MMYGKLWDIYNNFALVMTSEDDDDDVRVTLIYVDGEGFLWLQILISDLAQINYSSDFKKQ